MVRQIAIDADSMVDVALSRTGTEKENFLEEAYLEFCGQIKDVHRGVFRRYGWNKGDSIDFKIALSPKQSWRNRYAETYKANRKERSPEKTELLRLIWSRLNSKVIAGDIPEADDYVMHMARLGWDVAAIDKDIKLACPTAVFDYKKHEWNEPNDENTIERNIVMQAVKGDQVDGIKGAYGKGDKFCETEVLQRRSLPYLEYVSWFESEKDAIDSMRLVRMDQWTPDEGLRLWEPSMWKL